MPIKTVLAAISLISSDAMDRACARTSMARRGVSRQMRFFVQLAFKAHAASGGLDRPAATHTARLANHIAVSSVVAAATWRARRSRAAAGGACVRDGLKPQVGIEDGGKVAVAAAKYCCGSRDKDQVTFAEPVPSNVRGCAHSAGGPRPGTPCCWALTHGQPAGGVRRGCAWLSLRSRRGLLLWVWRTQDLRSGPN